MALAKHIQIAQTQGPKAGYTAYVETLERSGLDTAKASLNEIRSKGNKKAQFDFYCAKFGSKFGATPASVDEHDSLAEQLQVLTARLAELQAQGIGVVAIDEDTSLDEIEEDTSLDDVDDGWTQADTDAENAQGRSLLARALSPAKRRTSRSTTSTTRTNGGNGVSDKENLWKPWSIARFGIQPVVGSTFTYKSKRANRNTVHQVTRVTPDGIYAKRIK